MDKIPKDFISTKDTYYAALKTIGKKREEERDLTQSNDKSPYANRKFQNPIHNN